MKFTTEQQSFLEESLTVIEVDGKLVIGSLNADINGTHKGAHIGDHDGAHRARP